MRVRFFGDLRERAGAPACPSGGERGRGTGLTGSVTIPGPAGGSLSFGAREAYSVAMASRTGIREARSAGHRAAMTPTTTESTSMPTIWPQGMLRLVSP